MERNETRNSDHIVYIVLSITILGLLGYVALQSVFVIHKIELPMLQTKASMLGYLLSDPTYQVESQSLRNIRHILDTEFAKTNDYSTIKAGILKHAVKDASIHTQNLMRILTCVIVGIFGLLLIINTLKARHRLIATGENLRLLQQTGVDGFVHLLGKYLDEEFIEKIRKYPTPENLAHAFDEVREKVNIPCSVAARLFKRKTSERLILLEYGKNKVRFANISENNTVIPPQEVA